MTDGLFLIMSKAMSIYDKHTPPTPLDSSSSRYVSQCWVIVNLTLKNRLLIKIRIFPSTKMYLQISSAKWRPFCLGGDELYPWNDGHYFHIWSRGIYIPYQKSWLIWVIFSKRNQHNVLTWFAPLLLHVWNVSVYVVILCKIRPHLLFLFDKPWHWHNEWETETSSLGSCDAGATDLCIIHSQVKDT